MANQTSLQAHEPSCRLVATTTAQAITLDGQYTWTLKHNAETNASTPVTSTTTIWLAFDYAGTANAVTGTVDPTGAEGSNKLTLQSGGSATIGPNVRTLRFQLASGASDTPTFDLIRGDNYLGRS